LGDGGLAKAASCCGRRSLKYLSESTPAAYQRKLDLVRAELREAIRERRESDR
jgi:hypothetical protein